MTEESRVSRTPRTWPPGSSEPMDVAAVRSEQNGVVFKARDSKTWGRDWLATRESEGDGQYYRWFQMNSDSASEGAMTLVEVLPDAPEPQPERGAERCYYEGCPEWITGSSDYCPQHDAEYALSLSLWCLLCLPRVDTAELRAILTGASAALQSDQPAAALSGVELRDVEEPEAPKHSHGRDCCWECFHGPDPHPKEPNDPMCEYENCPPPHALVEERDDASEEQPGCCGACRGQGHVQGEPCSDCLTSGHAHDPADPCPAPREQP